jgi:leader peptidase (prepilin peptidase) / N-methyltransferase
MEGILLVILVSVFGICVGSFINVVVFRTKSGDPIARGRSKCTKCLEPVAAIDLVPILSYFNLRGKCRSCSTVISWQYPAVELAMGILFGLFFVKAVLLFAAPAFVDSSEWLALFVRDAVMAAFLVIIFVYDFKYQYILDRFTIPAMMLALVFNMALGADVTSMLLGGFLLGGFFAFQFLISEGKWVGGGDIRMGMLMGFLLGFEYGLLALFLSYILGAIAGIFLILTKKRKLSSQVPFGTFMAIGTIITMFFGQFILDWYLEFFV